MRKKDEFVKTASHGDSVEKFEKFVKDNEKPIFDKLSKMDFDKKEKKPKDMTFTATIKIKCVAKTQKEALAKFEATKVSEGVIIEGVHFEVVENGK